MKILLAALALLCGAASIGSCSENEAEAPKKLEDILAKLDRSAANFKGMTADLKETAHTAVIDEDQVESGTIRMKRARPGETRMLVDFTQPDPKKVELQGQTLQVYFPRSNTVQMIELGKNSDLIEQFLLLGFGTTRRDLATANDIAYGGIGNIDGRPAVRLVLVPKAKDVLQRVQKIELWLSPDTGYPLQHKIHQPGGDYQVFSFEHLNMNPPDLSDASLKLKLAKNAKVERLQH